MFHRNSGGLLYQLPISQDPLEMTLRPPRSFTGPRLLSTDDMVQRTLSQALAHPLWLEKMEQYKSIPERSSTPDSEPISSRITMQGPTKLVVKTMRGINDTPVTRLCTKLMDCSVGLQTAQHLHRQPADTAKMMQQRLQDVHGIIVELDESLGSAMPLLASHLPSSSSESSESASSTPTSASSNGLASASARQERAEALEACRQWLKEAQSYVLHVQRQLELLAAVYAADSPQWLEFVAYSGETLEKVSQEIRTGGTLLSQSTSRSSSPGSWRPRAVVRSAQLPYKAHWANKIAL